MSPIYVELLSVGIGFLKQFIASMTKSNAPQEVLDGLQAAITALETHQADIMSKADWESQRG